MDGAIKIEIKIKINRRLSILKKKQPSSLFLENGYKDFKLHKTSPECLLSRQKRKWK